MVSMQKELDVARKLAVSAGAILMDYFEKSVSVDWKAPGDPVTAADREANDFIVNALRKEFPDDGILSEEQEDDFGRLDRTQVWMIDPMDGTLEFIGRREDFAVQIGLVRQGTPVLGVVYQPAKSKLYYAAKGIGAFLEESGTTTPVRVSPETKVSNMKAAVSRSHRSARVDAILAKLGIDEFVSMGSVGLKVGLLCEGRAHIYIHTAGRTKLWDTCGPEAILREAGGRITDVTDNPLQYGTRELLNLKGLIATNGVVHERAVQVTQAVLATF